MASSSSTLTRESAQTPGSTAAAPWSVAAAISAAGAWPMRSPRFQKKSQQRLGCTGGGWRFERGRIFFDRVLVLRASRGASSVRRRLRGCGASSSYGRRVVHELDVGPRRMYLVPSPVRAPADDTLAGRTSGKCGRVELVDHAVLPPGALEPQKSDSSAIAFAARATPSGSDTGTPMSSTQDGFGPAAERVSSKQSRVAPSR
ncbi:hypothetical protein T492DRAFT_352058 [Pavlovales sp. CCMP2436]|nr:hypothetical protein T492DRAFT_352058 [Pavlovales sp. CCMP2436]